MPLFLCLIVVTLNFLTTITATIKGNRVRLKYFVTIVFALTLVTSEVKAAQIVSHPSGCPTRLFCGCGASVRIFGQPVRELFLARNWFKFPRTSPAPGMAAVRNGHVWVLEHHVSGNTWVGYDANSGGRKTRIHARSIAGYTIVNPR